MDNSILSYNNEINRKKLHLLSLGLPVFYILFPAKIYFFTLAVFISVLAIDILRIYKLYEFESLKKVIRSYEKNTFMTATYLIMISTFIIFFFNKEIAIYSLIIASICDTSAAIYGIKYGKVKLLNCKSLEGSLLFILTGFISILIAFFIIDGNTSVALPLFAVIFASFIEHVTPGKYDNITVPLSVALFLKLSLSI